MKEQIIALKKKLEKVKKVREEAEKAWEEAEKAREEAQQEGYDIGVAKTEEALKAEVSGFVGTTSSKYGMKLSTKLGLRLLLYLGR